MSGVSVARSFVDAVAWGDHDRVWELLAREGRQAVLRVALGRGMDDVLASRLREGTATEAEMSAFLADLVNGLRIDLSGTDLDRVEYVGGASLPRAVAEPRPGREYVSVLDPLPDVLGPEAGTGLPVATVELVEEPQGWRVSRLLPQRVR